MLAAYSNQYYLVTTNEEKLAILRTCARECTKNKEVLIFVTIVRNQVPKRKFGSSFLIDFVYYMGPNSVSDPPLIQELVVASNNYDDYTTENKRKVIGKYARYLRKNKKYEGSDVESRLLAYRRGSKQKFGVWFWNDLAYYMYN